MQYQLILAFVALSAAVSVETVTENSTVDVTITSCSGHPDCAATVAPAATTPAAAPSPAAAAAVPAEEASSSEEVIYVDVTTTPTVTASTGVEATVYQQSTLVSSYSSSNDSALAPAAFEGGANSQKLALGAGFAGLAAMLI